MAAVRRAQAAHARPGADGPNFFHPPPYTYNLVERQSSVHRQCARISPRWACSTDRPGLQRCHYALPGPDAGGPPPPFPPRFLFSLPTKREVDRFPTKPVTPLLPCVNECGSACAFCRLARGRSSWEPMPMRPRQRAAWRRERKCRRASHRWRKVRPGFRHCFGVLHRRMKSESPAYYASARPVVPCGGFCGPRLLPWRWFWPCCWGHCPPSDTTVMTPTAPEGGGQGYLRRH